MPRRAGLALAVAGMVAVLVTIPLGRWEASRAASDVQWHIDQVQALVGPDLQGPSLHVAAVFSGLTCFFYQSGGYVNALGLCYDAKGRLVRAEDARTTAVGLWSFQGWERWAAAADLPAVASRLEWVQARTMVIAIVDRVQLTANYCGPLATGLVPDAVVLKWAAVIGNIKICSAASAMPSLLRDLAATAGLGSLVALVSEVVAASERFAAAADALRAAVGSEAVAQRRAAVVAAFDQLRKTQRSVTPKILRLFATVSSDY